MKSTLLRAIFVLAIAALIAVFFIQQQADNDAPASLEFVISQLDREIHSTGSGDFTDYTIGAADWALKDAAVCCDVPVIATLADCRPLVLLCFIMKQGRRGVLVSVYSYFKYR